MKKLSIIIPCYNEEEVLPILYNALDDVSQKLTNYELEYIFVNDGSKDKTLLILMDLAKKDSKVKYISFSKNFGKESAMYAGLKNSTGDYVTLIDADMQDPPALIPEMLKIIEEEDYDSVATRRVTRKGEPKLRSFFARKFYKIINKISDADIVDGARDFRLMKRSMVDSIIAMSEYSRFSKGIFGWVGFKTYWYPYENIKRAAGTTKWSFTKLFKYSISGIVDFSNVLLYFPFVFSFLALFGCIGLLVPGIIYLVRNIYDLGYFFILGSIVCFVGFFVLFSFGLLGLYMAKIHSQVKNRPHYIVKDSNVDNINHIG